MRSGSCKNGAGMLQIPFITTALLLLLSLSVDAFVQQPPSTTIQSTHNDILRYKNRNMINTTNNQRHTNSLLPLQLTLTNPAVSTEWLSQVSSPLGSVVVLALVVLVHEAGHFLAARSMGISVSEFSVGVGPKLAGFTQTPKRSKARSSSGTVDFDDSIEEDSIDFNLRAIPLGGYVRFPENYNTTLEFQRQEDAQDLKQRAKKEAALMTTSPTTSTTSTTTTTTNKNENKNNRQNNKLAYNSDSDSNDTNKKWNFRSILSNLQIRKKNTSKTPKPIISPSGVRVEIDGTITIPDTEYYDNPNLLQNRPWTERAIVLSGGVIFNLLLAFSIYFSQLTIGNGIPMPKFDAGALVSGNPRSNGPSATLLHRGDVILALNGQPLTSMTNPTAYHSQEAISKFISQIRATTPGDSLHLTVQTTSNKSFNSIPLEKTTTQRPTTTTSTTIKDIDVEPQRLIPNDDSSSMSIGVVLAPNLTGKQIVKATNLPDAITIASQQTYELTSETARTLLTFLGSFLMGKEVPAGQGMSGPVGVIKVGSDVVSSKDFAAVLGFAAAISVNLAVVNSLPFPALDGGQLVFVLSEALTGKKIDQKKQEAINASFLFFLLLVSFSTTIGDLSLLRGGGK